MRLPSHRKMTRRQMLKLMGFSAAGTALAACTPAATQTAAPTPALDPTAIVPEGEIVIWDRAGDLFQVFDAAIPAFNKKYPNIKVDHQPVETNKLPPTLTTGVNVPDGAFIEDEFLGVISEHLYDITDLMQTYVDDLVGFKVRVNTHEGRIKGIPWDVDPALLYYRADILDEHGINVDNIQTYDDLLAAAKELQGKNPALKPIRIENNPGVIVLWFAMFANQQATSYIDQAGELQIESDKFLRSLTFVKRALDEGVGNRVDIFSPGDIAASDEGVQVFAPMAIWYNYGIGNLFKTSKGLWRATRLPAWEAGGARAASMGGSSFVIPAKGKNPQLAWLYYQFMMLTNEGIAAAFGPNEIYPGGIDTVIPSFKPSYASQLMANPESLGGQNLWDLATSVASDIPDNYYFPKWYSQMADIFGANVQRMYDGQLSPEEVLKQSAEDIRTKLMR